MGSGSLRGRQILDWSGKTADAPGHRALTLPSGGKEEMAQGEAGRKRTVSAVPRGSGKDSASPLGASPPGRLLERPPSELPTGVFPGASPQLRCGRSSSDERPPRGLSQAG